jgi:hypothetical protein
MLDRIIAFRVDEDEKQRIKLRAENDRITVTHLLRCIVKAFLDWDAKS